jgi:hypothetical protein
MNGRNFLELTPLVRGVSPTNVGSARHIICYEARQFWLTARDDGKGASAR